MFGEVIERRVSGYSANERTTWCPETDDDVQVSGYMMKKIDVSPIARASTADRTLEYAKGSSAVVRNDRCSTARISNCP